MNDSEIVNSKNTVEYDEFEEEGMMSEEMNKYKDNLKFIQYQFINKMNAIKETAENVIPKMLEENKNLEEITKDFFNKFKIDIENLEENNNKERIDLLNEFVNNLKKYQPSDSPRVITKSLFLNIFSEFDAYLNNLLRYIYKHSPQFINNSEKEFTVNDIFKFNTLDDFKTEIVNSEIDSLLRKSYIEQFACYEKKFSISTLKKFDNWKYFVEISQRRNILMHCDGRVTTQYYEHCKNNNCLDNNIQINEKVNITYDYLIESINIILEVGIKLIHVLWRKLFPKEIEMADKELNRCIYGMLKNQENKLASILGQFSCSLPRVHEKINLYLFIINYAIALKNLKKEKELKALLNDHDWSSVRIEFKLAHDILLDEYEDIPKLMNVIGTNSDLFPKESYLVFPIFDFVKDKEFFKNSFNDIFSDDFDTLIADINLKNEMRKKD